MNSLFWAFMSTSNLLKDFLKQLWKLFSTGPLSISGIQSRVTAARNFGLSWSGMLSRQLGVRAMLIVGVAASLYAGFLFLSDQISPTATSALHDSILKARWASPQPSKKIVIVDIDERSLAALAPEFGRWPWPRNVLADALELLARSGPRAVVFNVLLTDLDKSNPDADGALEVVSSMVPNVVYPLIRLNQTNDQLSQLRVKDLLTSTGDPHKESDDTTVAMLLPMFEAMIARSGIANQKPDGDGIIRKYPVRWIEPTFSMPTLVSRAVAISGVSIEKFPDEISLNWRNKADPYARVSFSDLLSMRENDEQLSIFKDSFVIIGVSAPGLGMSKATAVKSIEDDNEILATSLDDMVHGTYLRVMPAWLVFLIELITVWVLVWIGTGRAIGMSLNSAFVVVQSGAASITMLSASYTNYLIDLSTCMPFGLGVFGAIKLIHSLDAGWSRAKPGFRSSVSKQDLGTVFLIGYKDTSLNIKRSAELQRFLESQVGLPRVIRVDDLFGGESFARQVCEVYSCQFCLVDSLRVDEFRGLLDKIEFKNLLDIREIPLEVEWDPEDEGFRLFMAPYLLRQCAYLVENKVTG